MASTLIRVAVEATATTTEATTSLTCREVIFLSNDGSVPITFNFDAPTTASNNFTVKAGEQFTAVAWGVKQYVAYKTASGTAAFRIWGGG